LQDKGKCNRNAEDLSYTRENRESKMEPLDEVKASGGTQQETPTAGRGSVDLQNMRRPRVHIFDDDVSNLKMLKYIMSQRDYEILTFGRPVVCPNNDAKSEKCNISKPCADVIITDYQMPGMTGIEMLLQQAQRGCKIDIRNKILISADLGIKGQKTLEGLGCRFFSKPFKLSELLACLDDCEKRIDLSKPLEIKRREDRYPANIDIVYAYNSGEKIYKATVINYSNSGLCLKMGTPLSARQSILIKTELPIECNHASIRWVKETGADSYMAGCSCC
jgi:CheY-like chemotaxis protein